MSVTKKTDPKITEALLHDHAVLGTQDIQGWNEVHQVSIAIIIKLIFYTRDNLCAEL